MGGKTKKKQARKQAATRTKSNGGRNGVSGHMKKSSIGNGKRTADAGEGTPQLLAKKNGKNVNNQKSTNMKRKRDEDDDNVSVDSNIGEGINGVPGDKSDIRGSSMFNAVDDGSDERRELGRSVAAKAISALPKSLKKKQKLSDDSGSACKELSLSLFREIVPRKFIQLEDTSFSRLLYPNPVCFLTTLNAKNEDESVAGLNVMTLSWMTPVNNYGGFAFAIHKTRYSAANLLASQKFTLSVPTAESRDLVLSVGRVSGKVVKKFDGTIANLKAGNYGYSDTSSFIKKSADTSSSKNKNGFDALLDSDDEMQEGVEANGEASTKVAGIETTARLSLSSSSQHIFPPPIVGTVAHMNCTVISHTDAADAGTYLVIAKIQRASVHADYWSNKGKCFIAADDVKDLNVTPIPVLPSEGDESIGASVPSIRPLPPILSFLGSQRFGHLVAE